MKTYTICLTSADLALLYEALGELPLKRSIATFASLQQQQVAADVVEPEQLPTLSGLGSILGSFEG